MSPFDFRRIAVRAGLVRAKADDLTCSDWAVLRVAIEEGRQAYAQVMRDSRPPTARASTRGVGATPDEELMVQ